MLYNTVLSTAFKAIEKYRTIHYLEQSSMSRWMATPLLTSPAKPRSSQMAQAPTVLTTSPVYTLKAMASTNTTVLTTRPQTVALRQAEMTSPP